METFYFYSAIIGGTFMVGHLLLSLVGMHHDFDFHDMDEIPDADIDGGAEHGGMHAGGWFVGMLSFRAIVAALTVFGLVGMGASRQFQSAPQTAFIVSLIAAGGVMYLVGWIVRTLHGIRSDGTVNIENVIGENGSVYLAIPERNSGEGKVSVKVQGRTMEYQAMTKDDALPTGTQVVVLGVLSPGVVEVTRRTEHEI